MSSSKESSLKACEDALKFLPKGFVLWIDSKGAFTYGDMLDALSKHGDTKRIMHLAAGNDLTALHAIRTFYNDPNYLVIVKNDELIKAAD